jgi:hypothetical protein
MRFRLMGNSFHVGNWLASALSEPTLAEPTLAMPSLWTPTFAEPTLTEPSESHKVAYPPSLGVFKQSLNLPNGCMDTAHARRSKPRQGSIHATVGYKPKGASPEHPSALVLPISWIAFAFIQA